MVTRNEGSGPLRLLVLALVIAAAACDDTFEPTAPSDLGFSVFGYLDAGVDTQWVRVMPLRPVKVTSQDPFAATVTLEQLGTGQVISLRDSLFEFSPPYDWDLGAEDIYLHNFWTPEPIEPGATYRFLATREGKPPAEALVEIPPDYDVEVAITQVPLPGLPIRRTEESPRSPSITSDTCENLMRRAMRIRLHVREVRGVTEGFDDRP